MGLSCGHGLVPVDVPVRDHPSRLLGLEQDDAALRIVLGHLDGLVEEWLIVHHTAGLDAAGAGD
jgi:hypothetical protein